METFKIFYCWQSDHESKIAKGFIGSALQTAIDRVSAELEVSLIIDSDTSDVPGMPPVTETILRKIRECDFFLGDTTFVGETPDGKFLPNPNVMLEYGYALHHKGTGQILLAMNTAFGSPENLPFDLGHSRFPLQFEITPEIADSERRRRRALFAERLAAALKLMISHKLADPDTAPDAAELEAASALLRQVAGSWHGEGLPAVVTRPLAVLRVVPYAALRNPKLDPKRVFAARAALLPQIDTRAETGVDQTQWWSRGLGRYISEKPNPERDWASRLIRPGVVEWAFNIGKRIEDDPDIVVDGRDVEGHIVHFSDLASRLCNAIGLTGDALVSVSFIDVEDVKIARPRMSGAFRKPGFTIEQKSVRLSEKMGNGLQPLLDDFWLAAGFEDGSPSFANDAWTGYLKGR